MAEQEENAPEAITAEPTAGTSSEPSADNLDGLLAEFETATTPTNTPADDDTDISGLEQELSQYEQDQRIETAYHGEELEALRQQGEAATQHAQQLEGIAAELWQREQMRVEQEDWNGVLKQAKELIDDVPYLPADFAERWLMAESVRDPALRACWDARRNNQVLPATRHRAGIYMRNAMERMVKAAHEVLDPIASADKQAITNSVLAHMRGASRGGELISEPAPRLSDMSDRELNTYTRKHHGFDAI